jgi:hypothetical protein
MYLLDRPTVLLFLLLLLDLESIDDLFNLGAGAGVTFDMFIAASLSTSRILRKKNIAGTSPSLVMFS